MMRFIWDYIVLLLSIVGSIASIASIYYFDQQDQGKVAIIVLGILLALSMFYDWFYIRKNRKQNNYADIYSDINTAYSQIRIHKEDTIESIINSMNLFCDSLSNIFTNLHNTKIGVSIKLLSEDNGEVLLLTQARDSNSTAHGRPKGKSDKIKHWLKSNSDFNFIYNKIENSTSYSLYYYCPDIVSERDYMNTRLDNWTSPKTHLGGWIDNIARFHNWPLPYKSTLVVPIIPLNSNLQTIDNLRGFLCVDSPKTKSFNEDVDMEILRGAADELINSIDTLKRLVSEKRN